MLTILRKIPIAKANRRHLHTTHQRLGYIVLIPEIGEDVDAADHILKPDGLPAFKDITIENCLGAIGQQAGALEKTVKNIEETIVENGGRIDTGNMFQQLDEVTGPLDTTWGIAKALYLGNCNLIPTKTYMNIHDRARKARASKYNSRILYENMTQETESEPNMKRLLQKYQLEGKLNGLNLNDKNTADLHDAILELGKERGHFRNKINMSVHTFTHMVSDLELVRDFPTTLLEATATDPSQVSKGPWKITLQPQIVEGFLKYCPDRMQRWNVWQANVRKSSPQLDKNLETSTHIEKIRALRQRQANLLGYPNFAVMSMETKMVKNVDNLKEIFTRLLQHAGPAQSVEIQNLQNYAIDQDFKNSLELYDISYWQRKYLLSEHHLDEETIREYFPLPRVLNGLFDLCEKLFNIKIIQRKDAEVWQPAVLYYDVFDCDTNTSSKPVGGFYIDCYSKENKLGKNNGWMVSIRNRNQAAGLTPLSALIFNFTAPLNDKPYLLNFEDLRMVFKVFGTAMQHLLSQAVYTDLAGLSNIEWDASQVSGNVLSNFLDNELILKSISGHFASDQSLPDDLAKNIKLLKTNLAGYNLCQDLYLAHLDLELHESKDFWLDVVKKLWPVYRCLPLDKKDAHPCSMTEIFSGDWAAAQFSHLYSQIIAADIYASFDVNLSDASIVGKRFKATFLTSGGSIPSAEVFRRFRGRDPSVEALLKSLSIFNVSQTTGEL